MLRKLAVIVAATLTLASCAGATAAVRDTNQATPPATHQVSAPAGADEFPMMTIGAASSRTEPVPTLPVAEPAPEATPEQPEAEQSAPATDGESVDKPGMDWCPDGDWTGDRYDGSCGTSPKAPAAPKADPVTDWCPDGDWTNSRYDGSCGTAPKAPAPSKTAPPPAPAQEMVPDQCTGGDWTDSRFDGSCGTPPPPRPTKTQIVPKITDWIVGSIPGNTKTNPITPCGGLYSYISPRYLVREISCQGSVPYLWLEPGDYVKINDQFCRVNTTTTQSQYTYFEHVVWLGNTIVQTCLVGTQQILLIHMDCG